MRTATGQDKTWASSGDAEQDPNNGNDGTAMSSRQELSLQEEDYCWKAVVADMVIALDEKEATTSDDVHAGVLPTSNTSNEIATILSAKKNPASLSGMTSVSANERTAAADAKTLEKEWRGEDFNSAAKSVGSSPSIIHIAANQDRTLVLSGHDETSLTTGKSEAAVSEGTDSQSAAIVNDSTCVAVVSENMQSENGEEQGGCATPLGGEPAASDVESLFPAQTSPPPRNQEHLPGAHAIAGPNPSSSDSAAIDSSQYEIFNDQPGVDEELGEDNFAIQAEAHLVDEAAERARLQQQIMANAPTAAVLNVTRQPCGRRLLWAGALLFAVVALVLGLGVGLSSRLLSSAVAYNDMCAKALYVDKLPFWYMGVIKENSTVVESEALSCFSVDPSDMGNWFAIQGTGSCIRASIAGSNTAVSLSVFEGDCNELACIHDSGSVSASEAFWKSTLRSYYLLVTGEPGPVSGSYELSIVGYDCVVNDACVTATVIESLPFSGSGNTTAATPETAAALQCSNSPAGVTRGVFYEVQGTGSCVTASISGSDFNTMLAVYEGPCSELVCKTQELDGGNSSKDGSRIDWNSEIGAKYKIIVTGHNGSVGNYNLTVKENECDKCPGAIVVGGLPFSDSADIGFASDVALDTFQSSCHLIRSGYKGVWYAMKASSSHCTAVSTERSDFDFDTVIAVYEGNDCDSLSCVAENDDRLNCQESCKWSAITWTPTEGSIYRVLVAGKSGQSGKFGLDITEKQCDRCQGAISVGTLPYSHSYNNKFADAVEPRAVEECFVIKSDHRGVWYKFQHLGSGVCFSASTLGSELDTVLAVYDVETRFGVGGCESLKCLNSNNNLPPAPERNESDAKTSQIFWKGKAGTEDRPRDYFVFVGGFGGLTGNYNLSIREYMCLENDDCPNALFAEALPYFYMGTTVNATPDHRSGALECSVVEQGTRGVWHEFIGTGTCIAATLWTDFNDMIAVYDGDCGSLRCVVSDMNRIEVVKSKVTWISREGTMYKVFVAGFEDIVGAYNLSISECVQQSECLVATEISDIPFVESYTLRNSSLTPTEFRRARACDRFDWFGRHGYGYWYTLSGSGSCITASTAASDIDLDTVIGVYEGVCDDLVCVTDNDDGAVDWTSDVSWRSTVGTTYKILIAGLDTGPGPLVVNVTEYPCILNDACPGASRIDVIPYSVSGSTMGSTSEALSASACLITDDHEAYFSDIGFRLHEARGVWYEVDGVLGSCINVHVTSSSFPVGAAVYEGDCDSLSCQGLGLGGFSWNSTGSGVKYKILVAGLFGRIGDFNLTLTRC